MRSAPRTRLRRPCGMPPCSAATEWPICDRRSASSSASRCVLVKTTACSMLRSVSSWSSRSSRCLRLSAQCRRCSICVCCSVGAEMRMRCASCVSSLARPPTVPSNVAENIIVWRSADSSLAMWWMSSMKPMSSMRSASSRISSSTCDIMRLAAAHVVDQATRGGDQDVQRAAQRLQLGGVGHAADDGGDAQALHVAAVDGAGLADLHGQFAGGGEHEHARAARLAAFALLGRVAARFDHALQGRQHEGRGLAAAGARGHEQVDAGDGGGDGLQLDVGRLGVAGFRHGAQDFGSEAQRREAGGLRFGLRGVLVVLRCPAWAAGRNS